MLLLDLDLIFIFATRASLLFVDGQNHCVLVSQQRQLRGILLDQSYTSATTSVHAVDFSRQSTRRKLALSGTLLGHLSHLIQIHRFQLLVSNAADVSLYHISIVFLRACLDDLGLNADHQSMYLLSMIQQLRGILQASRAQSISLAVGLSFSSQPLKSFLGSGRRGTPSFP